MSMIDDAADETKDAIKRAREREQKQEQEREAEGRETEGDKPVANLE